jgi:hypothetical protein
MTPKERSLENKRTNKKEKREGGDIKRLGY